MAAGAPWPADLGIDLSRGFRALKVWFTVKEHGFARLGEAIAGNCRLARSLAERIAGQRNLKLAAPVPLNIVCCRYLADDLSDEDADRLNARLVAELQESGVAAPSTCRIDGRLCIRICILNHRTSEADLDILVEAMLAIGRRLATG